MVPFWTSFLIRTYAWMSILASNGVINSVLRRAGVVDQPIQLLYTMTAVVIAGIYLYLPFAVLSIYTSLEKLGASLEEAAMDLGAGPWTTFRRVTFPLSLAGVQAAVIFVFVPALGLFVTPALLGGANATMIGNLQVTIFKTSLDFALGSAVSFVVLAVALVAVALFGRSVDLERVYAGGVGQLTARRGGPGHGRFGILGGYATLTYAFLFLPVAFLILFSFSSAAGGVFPPPGYTLQWYREALDDPWLMTSVWNSFMIAVLSALIAVVIATPGAYAIVRYRFPGRGLVRQALIIPLIVPTIMLGFGLMLLFKAARHRAVARDDPDRPRDLRAAVRVLRDRGPAVRIRPHARGGGHGPGRRPAAHVPVGDAAPDGPRAGRRGHLRVHALARRVHHHVPADEHDADAAALRVGHAAHDRVADGECRGDPDRRSRRSRSLGGMFLVQTVVRRRASGSAGG